MMVQCKFYDKENDATHGGIIDDDGNIICGCCGCIIEANDIGDEENKEYSIVEIYNEWVSLDSEITGEDLFQRWP